MEAGRISRYYGSSCGISKALSSQGVLIVPESMLTWKHQYISSGRPKYMFHGLGVDRPISFQLTVPYFTRLKLYLVL